jgi:hypothetical protein
MAPTGNNNSSLPSLCTSHNIPAAAMYTMKAMPYRIGRLYMEYQVIAGNQDIPAYKSSASTIKMIP